MRFWHFIALAFACLPALAEQTNYPNAATFAWKKGEYTNAIAIMTEGIAVNPKEPRYWNVRAQMYALQGKNDEAIADLSEAIRLEPASAFLWQERAKLRFKRNKMSEAVADFDRAIRLRPESEPYNWERGIALYYAGYFTDGRRQFESHQTVNSNDVENAVWHFLCVVRAKGLEEARKNLIPIQGDTRVPMKQVHELFAGKAKVEDVLAAAEAPGGAPKDTALQKFYAHLYLGLYFEAIAEPAKCREHILAAVQLADVAGYMGDVARVHAERLEKPAPGK